MCTLLENWFLLGHCNSISGFQTDKRIALFLKILSKRHIVVSTLTFESMQYVMEDVRCSPLFILCYNNTNSIQQSLVKVIWFNIPAHVPWKIYITVVNFETNINGSFHNFPYYPNGLKLMNRNNHLCLQQHIRIPMSVHVCVFQDIWNIQRKMATFLQFSDVTEWVLQGHPHSFGLWVPCGTVAGPHTSVVHWSVPHWSRTTTADELGW
jgi:hypothetical protein